MKVLKGQRALIPFVVLLGLVNAGAALADATSFKVPLTGAQGVPPVDTAGTGTAAPTYNPATRGVPWENTHYRLYSPPTMAPFPRPARGGKKTPPPILAHQPGRAPP